MYCVADVSTYVHMITGWSCSRLPCLFIVLVRPTENHLHTVSTVIKLVSVSLIGCV